MDSAHVGSRVRALREKRHLNHTELAAKAGTHENTIRLIESGEGNPTIGTLSRLAGALGVSLASLVR